MNIRTLAKGLGWFSIGLGLAEVLAPQAMARMLGMKKHSSLLRGYGFREMAAGLGILSNRGLAAWLWARVAGDALDLATLGAAAFPQNPRRRSIAAATAAVAGVTALDVYCGSRLSAE